MATARYIPLANINITSGSTTVTINSTEPERFGIQRGDLIHVAGRLPLIIESIQSSDPNNPTTYEQITLRHAATYTEVSVECVVVSGNIRASESIQTIEDNNQLWADNFGLFLTWISSQNTQEPLRDVNGDVNNYTTPQGLISAYNSVEKVYALPNTSSTGQWVKLGRWDTSQIGKKLHMRILTSRGYNAITTQQNVTELSLNTSNNSSNNNGFYISGVSWRHGHVDSPSNIKIVQIDVSTYDVYAEFGAHTGSGCFYQVATLQDWTHDGTLLGAGTPPTGLDITINTVAYV